MRESNLAVLPTHIPCDPASPLLGIDPTELSFSLQQMCTKTPTAMTGVEAEMGAHC